MSAQQSQSPLPNAIGWNTLMTVANCQSRRTLYKPFKDEVEFSVQYSLTFFLTPQSRHWLLDCFVLSIALFFTNSSTILTTHSHTSVFNQMRASSSVVVVLAFASGLVPALAAPTFTSLEIAKRGFEEQVAQVFARAIREDPESGALSWADVKKFGKKVFATGQRNYNVAAPIVEALTSHVKKRLPREELDLYSRLEYVIFAHIAVHGIKN
ncbi:hypothetical protein NLI96_g13070 [Meripilus lineatus]|uniref:Uncharacterized protein n=1 Tax=Meripilus lineatus TaxID=2056292 RepID=A0AAD5UR58_9APHY|nr:hypothetical protein NLI96_g13070 [Physisporinus lineatus]